MKNRAALSYFLASFTVFMLATAPVVASGFFRDFFKRQEINSFVYPKGYSELSKKRVDQLRKIHYVFDTICSRSYEHGWDRDKIVARFEEMCINNDMKGHSFVSVADWSIDKALADPVERVHAKKTIEQAIDNFCPFSLNVNSEMIQDLDGFVYLITKDNVYECSTIGPVDLSCIMDAIAGVKRHFDCMDGYHYGINGYLIIKCLQTIKIFNPTLPLSSDQLMRINAYQKINAALHEDRLVNIIADKDLVVLPELGTVMGTTDGITYRLKGVRELETNDAFLVLTLSVIS